MKLVDKYILNKNLFRFRFSFLQSGKLQIFDISSATLLESEDAHSGAVWSMCMAPDKVGCNRYYLTVKGLYDRCVP